MPDHVLSRRALIVGAAGAAGAAAAGLAGCSGSGGSGAAPTAAATRPAAHGRGVLLWRTARERGIVYGSSTATWQISDPAYRRLFEREAAILFTEDDLLWYRLRPRPGAALDLSYGDRIVDFARRNAMLVFGAHLAWDQGFGDGWTNAELLSLGGARARRLLYGTIDSVVRRYRGRVAAWSVVNEALDGSGVRTDVPWYVTIGPSYIAESFQHAHAADPGALLVLNDFGFENDDDFAVASFKRQAALDLLDELLAARVPVHALGVQAHLQAGPFAGGFDAAAYRRFLAAVAKRGLHILITELDVLDDGLPADPGVRDAAVAGIYRRYLSAALAEPAVGTVMTFGLSDRYTWLQEDYPRKDGAPRRPLPFDRKLRPKPAYDALSLSLAEAPRRRLLWQPRPGRRA